MPLRSFRLLAATSALALCLADAQAQTPVPRPTPAAGAIVAVKGGEEMRFVREDLWRTAPIQQNVVGGDTLRTNEIGNLAILFADQTQIRVGRNSVLTVNDVAGGGAGNTQLSLQGGSIWARAARGGSGVDVKTPAAVAAIRGTDWSLSVEGGRTSLVVLEGVVELSNPQGSVTVRQGEGAVATIGQAPTKFVLTNSEDREQMLFYMSLRDTFSSISTSPLAGPALRAERARIAAIAPGARSAEDWLSLAEIAPSLDGRAAAAQALAEARSRGLSASQRARADLVEAALLGSQHRWREAAALFAKVERGVDPKRHIFAAYGRYVAQSLADPKRAYPEPRLALNDPFAVLAHAYVVAFRQDLQAAADVLREARKRFPNDARLAVMAAQIAYALNRREEMREAIAQAKAIDPDDPEVIATDSNIRGDIDGEVNAAVEALRRAAAIAPGNSNVWNSLGLFESDRDRPLAAEEALRRGIEADPGSPVSYANLAILLLDQNRVEEAGALIDKALSLDPAFSVGYIARGRYLLQKGEAAKGLEAILAGSAANPGLSQGVLMAAVAYYQNGEEELADQALDNADRLDPNDPVVASFRTAIAIDQYQADQAVLAAREAVRRYRQRGGDFAGLAINKEGGSYPAQAYRFLNLNEWSRFYGDRVFDRFSASTYFDQAAVERPALVTGRPSISTIESGVGADLTALNLTIQGLFFDPLAVSGRIGRLDLLRRPFLDVEVGGSLLHQNGRYGWGADATVQGFSNEPLPTSFTLTASRTRPNGRDPIDREDADNGSFFIGSAPSAANRFLVFGAASGQDPALARINTPTNLFQGRQNTASMLGGAGWSHSFSDHNVLTAAVFGLNGLDRRFTDAATTNIPGFLVGGTTWERNRTEGASAAVSHMIGLGDLTLQYGFEAQRGRSIARTEGRSYVYNIDTGAFDFTDIDERTDASFSGTRLYADVFWRPSDWFEAQAGIERSTVKIEGQREDEAVSPRVGLGISPFEGQWLRAAYRQDRVQPIAFTLAPVTTVGLVPNALPTQLGAETETLALRWDAEWSPHVFTAVEYQRQEAQNVSLPMPYSFDSIDIERARIERLAATANLWLTHGIGVFGTIGTIASEVSSGEARGADVPFIAGKFARAGMTFVHPSRLKFTLAGTFVGDIKGNLAGREIDSYWTSDAALTWETPDRRLMFGLSVLNLFDENYELAPDIRGPGRTFEASLKARF
ncbi:FecR domain-containing protein [Microvirga arsenatis]|uniref:TonB-dependent receptor n=1 Tax=Microvirga arsenatis TaxID=2692265 RepID=A0ABW9YWJ7_9HYPH|nr:FecR domain-containing protein [Microvirga arsenatis]NBJ10339.1 TonB-dependent receptor [Microvirga arsenatis]NBJ24762.1 TonB-dependent receptor [Microvirga arsenatis]